MGDPYHRHDIEHELAECCLDCQTSLDVVKRHLLAFRRKIVEVSPDLGESLTFDDVYAEYAELDDVVRLHAPGEDLVTALLADAEVRAALPDLRKAHSAFFQLHECRFAEEILADKQPWAVLERFVFYPNYVALVDAEVCVASLTPADEVVFIGAGPFPLTNILLAARHGVRTIAVEEDATLADLAERLVARLGLDERIEVEIGDHRWLSDEWIPNLVMVAAQANPRQEILEHLRHVLPVDTHVSLRTYEKGLRRILAGEGNLSLPEGFTVVEKVNPGPPVNNTIVLLERAWCQCGESVSLGARDTGWL